MQLNEIKRWYDKDPRMSQILDILENMPEESKVEFARILMSLINILRKDKKNSDAPLSLGKSKVLGLYKAFNKRRWYDQSHSLMHSLNILSTLELEDFNTVVDGILMSFTDIQ